jgi:TonB family protein
MESFPVNLKSAPGIKMDVSLRSSGTSFFVELRGSGIGANTVDIDDQVIFLLENDSTVTVKSRTAQTYDYSKSTNTYKHEYWISLKDLEYLSKHNLQALRKYSSNKFDDIYLGEENADKVKALSALFINELKKSNVLQTKAPLIPPGFPGGNEVLLNFLNRNLKPPPELQSGEKKLAVVQFLVKADGSINDFQIKQSAGLPFDNEVLRVLKRMPKWKPAMDNGKKVDAIVTQPVTFSFTNTTGKVQF